MQKNKILIITCVILLIIISVFALVKTNASSPPKITKKKEIEKKPVLNEFGLQVDSLKTLPGKVKRNETISSIFSGLNISSQTIEKIKDISKGIFNLRKIISGKNYFAYLTNDTLSSVKYFVYEKDPVNYVVFDFQEPIKIYEGKKEIKYIQKSVSGRINNSLYESLMNSDADPELVIKLSEIYAWQIDFYRIQKGDNYKVIYEEKYVDDEPVGIGKIIAAEFTHDNENYFAIPFIQNDQREFFDENGNSLQKEFLKAPIKFSRITSRFSRRRFHPILKRYKSHLGTDYAAPTGTPIHTVGDGVVIAASYTSGNGNYVKIRHNGTYTTQYLHMSRFAKGIKPGKKVKQGDVIGYVGSTGLATGPHVCFRFWKNGVQVNPLKEKIPPSHPIKKENLNAFNKKKIEILEKLSEISLPESDENPSA